MAEAYRKNGFKILIYSNDHPPPHVHVLKAEGHLVFELGSKSTELSLVKVLSHMKSNDALQAREIVEEQHKNLLNKWSEIHGHKEV